LEKGDKLRVFNRIRVLSKQHEVYVFCITSQEPTDEEAQALAPYCREIYKYQPSRIKILFNIVRVALCGKPWQNAFFEFKKAKQIVQKIVKDIQPDHVFVQGVRMADYAEQINIPKTLDYEDAHSLRMLRFSEQAKFPMSRVYKSEHKRLKIAETKAFENFDHKLIISETDRMFVNHPNREEILIVRNGVDLDFFKPDPNVRKTADLLFVGNLSYPPNIQSVRILLEDIMPKLIEKNPLIKLLIAGANPPQKWFKHQSANIEILPNPKDIREAYNVAKIFVAPMMTGTGMQNKLLEAMAMKLPCVTTPLANLGLRATPNTEILIAETPDEFVNQILFLQNNPNACRQFSEQAFDFVKSFSWGKELEKWTCKISENPVK
jgi:glycosyltransferase involved in cell wall biosynthesis